MALFRTHSRLKAVLLALALGASLSTARAASQEPPPAPELNSDTSDTLNSDFRPAYDAKDWDKALTILDGILAKVPADSYDAVYVYRAEAQLYLQNKNNMALGLQDLERAIAINDRKHYYGQKDVQDMLYSISQLNFNEAVTTKDAAAKPRFFAKTVEALDRWLGNADLKSLNQDSFYYVAVVYFTMGQGTETGSEQKMDKAMMEKAMTWIDKGLRSVTRPRDTFYQMKIAGLYQLDRFQEATDYLELEVKQKPDNKNYWQQLASMYLQLASVAEGKKDPADAFSYNVRAIVTIERAQKLGYMVTPKDNFNLLGLYSNINQYARACELLENGLRGDTIESTSQNWTILGGWFQLIHRNDKAIETFLTAAKLFPSNAEIEYQLAQVYLGVPDEAKAFEHIKACIAKGGTDKPHVAWLFYAYTAMDLQKFDDALKGAHEAAAAAKKINATDAIKQAEKMEAAIKASLLDLQNRQQQLQH